MTPNRPYLLRAFYDWIVDNQCTPHLVVNADFPNVQVPTQFVQDGQIVLNISPSAVTQFSMDNVLLTFNARFGGQPMQVYVPMGAVLAIYARENGEGTVFTQDETYEEQERSGVTPSQPQSEELPEPQPGLEAIDNPNPQASRETSQEDKSKGKKGSHLKVIK
ncbi:ClpXP protease specificity-enhancing factor [Pseudoalteromonas ruthenica]|uniref:ClpXP protease specificity-enhancing factor n=1 Tax=Pseudoalteromonas ruthenica TaxID=151081 RepID=UPI001107B06A|nr:ClpXP protease specificity-enhancing factor [Pseudoalteromonas ruthenica]TLX52133.1 ClpXP protease specificity-enhancing factor [Pseudoalteromonas ruthenica]